MNFSTLLPEAQFHQVPLLQMKWLQHNHHKWTLQATEDTIVSWVAKGGCHASPGYIFLTGIVEPGEMCNKLLVNNEICARTDHSTQTLYTGCPSDMVVPVHVQTVPVATEHVACKYSWVLPLFGVFFDFFFKNSNEFYWPMTAKSFKVHYEGSYSL